MKNLNVVAAIIIHNGQILCMQRGQAKQDYISYKYEFPGGKIELGETRTEALRRELKEEMNIEVKIAEEDYFMTVNHSYPDFELTMHSYICRVDTKEFVRKEHIDHQWMTPQELKTLEWAPADYPIVESLRERDIC